MKRLCVLLVALAGCQTNLQIDPEGYRCDTANPCPTGYQCVGAVCEKTADGCVVAQCNMPPASVCNGTTARTFVGRCGASGCLYDAVDQACAKGCVAGLCVDACGGVSCTTPPVTTCLDANTLRSFAQTGTCSATTGTCSYTSTDVTCPSGCEAGRCKGANLCAGVVCTTPPAAVCVGTAARTFSATGTCEPTTGQCTYGSMDTQCAAGCFAGQCLTASLAFSQVGPKVRFAINGLDVAPGGGTVLAVGNGGHVARWNGTDWAEVTTPSTSDLNKVNFVAAQVAFIVGKNLTAWSWRSNTASFTVQNLSGPSSTNLIAVSGRSESNALLADPLGNYWKLSTSGWSAGAVSGPLAVGPFAISQAYVDETLRDRLSGTCDAVSCIAYKGNLPTSTWFADGTGTLPFDAVGGSFAAATSTSSEALAGTSANALQSHQSDGTMATVSPTPALAGGGVVGITADGSGGASRSVYVLTSSAKGHGRLYQLDKVGTVVTSRVVLETFLGAETLSPTVAAGATPGIVLAETDSVAGSNNVFRHSALVDEALDLGVEFAAVSTDGTALAVSNPFGDLGLRRAAATTWDFRRANGLVGVRSLEARNGTGVLLAGTQKATGDGALERWSAAGGYSVVATRAGTTFNELCRASDSEGWAVGTGGTILSVTSTGAVAVSSGTTEDLLSVDCSAGAAVACGANGTVVRFAAGAWTPVTPAFPLARPLTACRKVGATLYAGGDGVFAKFENGAWTQLPAKAGLTSLVARSPGEVYASVTLTPGSSSAPGSSAVVRFDGTQWSSNLATVTGVLRGGVQVGTRVVFGGTGGVLVEGR